MIKHIVMWKIKKEFSEEEKKAAILKIKSSLEELCSIIEEIKELEVGINFQESQAACDLVLYSVFNSKEDLEAYQKHPAHQEVVDYVKSVVAERSVVDYEL